MCTVTNLSTLQAQVCKANNDPHIKYLQLRLLDMIEDTETPLDVGLLTRSLKLRQGWVRAINSLRPSVRIIIEVPVPASSSDRIKHVLQQEGLKANAILDTCPIDQPK